MRMPIALLLLLATVCASNVVACGDKFVVFGQGVRFQRAYAALHPASILVYWSAGSRRATPESRDRLVALLRMVGHHPQLVSTKEEMKAAVGAGAFDIVLTEFANVSVVGPAIASAKMAPAVVPMVFEPTRGELTELEKQNSCTVGVSKRNHELLTVINDVMAQRLKGLEACQRKKA